LPWPRRTDDEVRRRRAFLTHMDTAVSTAGFVRIRGRRTKPLRGGRDRDPVRKRSALAARPTGSGFAPRCTNALRRAILRHGDVGGGLRPVFHLGVVRHSSQNAPFAHLFNLRALKAKPVPVAASSSAFASARPTRPGMRPRSATALRIQDSADDAACSRRALRGGQLARRPWSRRFLTFRGCSVIPDRGVGVRLPCICRPGEKLGPGDIGSNGATFGRGEGGDDSRRPDRRTPRGRFRG
jgi:hypothetical protein